LPFRVGQGASLIRIPVLILVRTIYLRLLPSFANCFLFSREPKKKQYSKARSWKTGRDVHPFLKDPFLLYSLQASDALR
jgi:hypothetical protein